MGEKEFCEEVGKVLKEIGPEGKDILRKLLKDQDQHLTHNIWRYKTRKDEEAYDRILEFRKLKNLVEYLLNLDENDKEEK